MSAQKNTGNSNNIFNDIANLQFKKDIKNEYRELKNFYLNDEKKDKLKNMGKFKQFFFQVVYLFSSIFQKLTPFRKFLVFLGLLLLFISNNVNVNNQSYGSNNAFWGGLIIFFVLVLELKDKLLAVEELVAGRKIQKALMPEECPGIDGWDVFLFTTSANEVSGDLVDYLKINEEKTSITIADVAGKGLSAALLTAKLQATVRAFADTASSPAELTSKTNHIFNRDSLPNLFASMIYLEISPNSNEIKFTNAGHFPPLVIKDKEIKEFEKGGAALGLIANAQYIEQTTILEQNEFFVAYSDGVTEAMNEIGDFFGKERLFKLIKNSSKNSSQQLGKLILAHLEQFKGDYPMSDDISIIILKRKL